MRRQVSAPVSRPHPSTSSSGPVGVSIHWFRKGLRIHDNPALLRAADGASSVLCVYCLDPWFADPSRVGANRYRFLLDSLSDLDKSLRSLGSRLFVYRGKPAEILPRLWTQYGAKRLTFERDTEPYAVARDKSIEKAASEAGVQVLSPSGHTLHDIDAIIAKAGGAAKVPTAYQSFIKIFESLPPPAKPLPAPAAGALPLGPVGSAIPADEATVPSLAEMGYDPGHATSPFRGGETEALHRLNKMVTSREAWVAAFAKPDTSPNALEPSTTVLSPYLKFGCLSPRTFWHALDDIYKRQARHTQPPVSLQGQLLWREFFYTQSVAVPNFDRMVGNPVCKQIAWDYTPAYIAAWTEARTGYPWIDAAMTQLRVQGWMHHLARHAVACFLTRGDLYQSWEQGAKVFDVLLLDSDFALNNGNWMWLSASAYFYQYFRVYSPVAFPKKTDPNGDYIRKWLPQFKNFPAKFIYEPWLAPLDVQRAHGVVVGKSYPERIVVHEEVSKRNIDRHTAAYAANKDGKAKAVAAASAEEADLKLSGVGGTQVASDEASATRIAAAMRSAGLYPFAAAPSAPAPSAAVTPSPPASASASAPRQATLTEMGVGKRARGEQSDAHAPKKEAKKRGEGK